jgi:hypothetical protein
MRKCIGESRNGSVMKNRDELKRVKDSEMGRCEISLEKFRDTHKYMTHEEWDKLNVMVRSIKNHLTRETDFSDVELQEAKQEITLWAEFIEEILSKYEKFRSEAVARYESKYGKPTDI